MLVKVELPKIQFCRGWGPLYQMFGIVVVGLQEVEMGAGFLAMSATEETVGLEGSAMEQWWVDTIGKALEEGKAFERMGSRQLAGFLISLWVRKNLRKHVGDMDAEAVPCGFGRAIGNKVCFHFPDYLIFGDIMTSNEKIRSMLEESCYVPQCNVSPDNIVLENQEASLLLITNRSTKDKAVYKITCEGQSIVKNDGEAPDYIPRAAFGFPRWLESLYDMK